MQTAKSNVGRIRGQHSQFARMINGSSARVKGPSDPPPVTTDIVLTKIFRKAVTVSSTAPVPINGTFITGCIPGGVATFDRFRVLKISAYGPANLQTDQTSLPSLNLQVNDDLANFNDEGVYGSKRPALHISPGFDSRLTWRTDSSGPVATVSTGATTPIIVIIDLTLELRTVSQTCPA